MAIRTKKISDLSKIEATAESLVLGVNGGTTGKIELSEIAKFVKSGIQLPETQKSEVTKDDLVKVQDSVTKCETVVATAKKASDELASKFTTMVYSQTHKNADYESKISALEARCETLEGLVDSLNDKVEKLIDFVHSLQGEGYLTLANIKRLAAEHCPCEGEIHNGEQVEPTE